MPDNNRSNPGAPNAIARFLANLGLPMLDLETITTQTHNQRARKTIEHFEVYYN
jgi:hypothetical protein